MPLKYISVNILSLASVRIPLIFNVSYLYEEQKYLLFWYINTEFVHETVIVPIRSCQKSTLNLKILTNAIKEAFSSYHFCPQTFHMLAEAGRMTWIWRPPICSYAKIFGAISSLCSCQSYLNSIIFRDPYFL